MIRINLLGRVRPKAARKAVPLEGALQAGLLLAAVVFSIGVLWYEWAQLDSDAQKTRRISRNRRGRKRASKT